MAESVLTLERFSYRYPGADGEALRDLTLSVDEGELVVLAGLSGSGKTTLLRAACGLVPHFHGGEASGRLEVGGLDVREHGPAELGREAGFVSQEPEAQVVSTTVRAELELPLELRGERPAARARAVEEVALALAIPHLLDRATDTLSAGELQRVALAAALAPRPNLVLLDEPTSQLDPVAGDELIWLLRRLNEEWGTAIVLGEHRTERCLAAADRVIALSGGGLGFDGLPSGFLDWAVAAEPPLLTPAGRLFSLAGLHPLPTGVKDARRTPAAARGLTPGGQAQPASPSPWGQTPGGRGGALEVRDLWVELDPGDGPRDVLRGVELAIDRGERVALMGRNGAGKSTLLRACTGLLDPARGRAEAPAGCALLGQSPGDLLLRDRTGDELPGEDGAAALRRVGLGWARDRDPADLSGGERQRLALAIATAGRSGTGIVCLDEPTRGMDRARKDDLVAWLHELAATGSAVLVATHDVEFAAALADRVILLGDGVPVADDGVREVLSGGWYFATEVARILPGSGAITPEEGAELLRARPAAEHGPLPSADPAPPDASADTSRMRHRHEDSRGSATPRLVPAPPRSVGERPGRTGPTERGPA
jgi:energy-coupling factor transport system ATP-binding protein